MKQAILKIEKIIFDTRIHIEKWINNFITLNEVVRSKQKRADLFSRMLLTGDFELKLASQHLIQDLFESLALDSLFHKMSIDGQREVLLSLKNLASQPKAQWKNVEVGKSLVRLLESPAAECLIFYK